MIVSTLSRIRWFLLAGLLLLCALTAAALTLVDRFYVEKEQLLEDTVRIDAQLSWDQKGGGTVDFSDDSFVLRSDSVTKSASISQDIDIDSPIHLKLQLNATAQGVVLGPEHWAGPNATLMFYDQAGTETERRVFRIRPDSKPEQPYIYQTYSREGVSKVGLALRLLRSEGQLSISNLTLSHMQEFSLYKNVRLLVVVVWVFTFAALMIVSIRIMRRPHFLGLGFLTAATLIGVLLPEPIIDGVIETIVPWLPSFSFDAIGSLLGILHENNGITGAGAQVSKMGHFALFACIGVFVGCNSQNLGIPFALASIFVFAVITEILQMFVNDRSPSTGDLIVDCIGGLLGFIVGCVALQLYLRLTGKMVAEP